jgi:hypothetical protein
MKTWKSTLNLCCVKFSVENTIHTLTSSSIAMCTKAGGILQPCQQVSLMFDYFPDSLMLTYALDAMIVTAK